MQYWTRVFGINAGNLREAVADVGPMVKDVRKLLGQEIKDTSEYKKQTDEDTRQFDNIT